MFLSLGLLYKMSIGEAAIAAVISICIVLAILSVIAGVLSLFTVFYNMENKKKAENLPEEIKEERIEEQIKSEPIPITEERAADEIDEKELVAVITAAIAASAKTTTDKIIVRSIRKASSWKNTALKEKTRSIV